MITRYIRGVCIRTSVANRTRHLCSLLSGQRITQLGSIRLQFQQDLNLVSASADGLPGRLLALWSPVASASEQADPAGPVRRSGGLGAQTRTYLFGRSGRYSTPDRATPPDLAGLRDGAEVGALRLDVGERLGRRLEAGERCPARVCVWRWPPRPSHGWSQYLAAGRSRQGGALGAMKAYQTPQSC